MNHLPISTQRLRLRAFRHEDLSAFVAYRADPGVARYQSWSDYTLAMAEQFYASQQNLPFDTEGSWFQLAIERRDDGHLLGDVAVHFFDQGHQVELGFTLAAASQGQGYAREALRAVLELVFSGLGKHRAVATVDARNLPAQRLLTQLGFRREGEYRQNVLFKGNWSDEHSYALLASEWRGRQPPSIELDGG
ncbi:GNAT family N-acetyltransferase [Frateuria aurantia]